MKSTSKTNYINIIVTSAIFCVLFVLLVVRAPYGWVSTDEAYYVASAERLVFGDLLITDEWCTAQNWGTVESVFYLFFHIFSSSNDGIILYSRYIYCILWTLVAFICYRTLSKKYAFSQTVFAYIILFAPFEIMTLCYNTGMLSFLLLLCCVMFSFAISPQKNLFVSCILFSVTSCLLVISCPFMVLAFISGYLFAGLLFFIKRKNEAVNRFVKMLYYSIPLIALFAALYLYIFMLRGESFNHISLNLNAVLNLDSSHSVNAGVIRKLYRTIISLLKDCPVLLVSSGIIILTNHLIKKNKLLRLISFSVLSLEFVFYQLMLIKEVLRINNQILYIVIFGTTVFFLLKNKPLPLFFTFSVPGALFVICECIGSNTGLMALSFSSLIMGVPAIIYIILFLTEMKIEWPNCMKVLILLTTLVFTAQFSIQIYKKMYQLYSTSKDSVTIEVGAQKGIIADSYSAKCYKTDYSNLVVLFDMAGISRSDKIRFLTFNHNPVMYLDAGLGYGTYSPWTDTSSVERKANLELYYTLNPENIPSVVLCTEAEEEYLPEFCQNYNLFAYNGMILLIK